MYDDAEEVTTPTAKGLPEGIQSPDSGIHGDKSSTDITAWLLYYWLFKRLWNLSVTDEIYGLMIMF